MTSRCGCELSRQAFSLTEKACFSSMPVALKPQLYSTSAAICQKQPVWTRLCTGRVNGLTVGHRSYYDKRSHQRRTAFYSYLPVTVAFGIVASYIMIQYRQGEVECQLDESQSEPPSVHKVREPVKQTLSLEQAISESDQLLQTIKLKTNSPGLSVAVTVDGKEVWTKGYGVADIENVVPCRPSTVMRIASISKPLTMVAIARLWEAGKLDLDKSIRHYVPSWPEKNFKGQTVTITTRQLVSMMSGVRHYDKQCRKKPPPSQKKAGKKENEANDEKSKSDYRKDEFDNREYYIKKHYPSISSALELFKNDELCSMPGTEFLYSSHAWTLVSAVVEGASGRKFTDVMLDIFHDLGLDDTYLDENRPIIPNRARYYVMDKEKRQLVNAPYVDNSYKWAGGGFLSTVNDLCQFGNSMLYSYQWTPVSTGTAGYLKPETTQMIWSPVAGTKCSWDRDGSYAMGWGMVPLGNHPGFTRHQQLYVSHTGGAVGASSVLLILPKAANKLEKDGTLPQGVVVAVIVNMQSVNLNKVVLKIAKLFEAADV